MITLIAVLLGLHFVADFLLQSNEMARQKSEKLSVLFKHVSIHFLVFILVLPFFVSPHVAAAIAGINAGLHAIIDWNIWNAYKYSVWLRNSRAESPIREMELKEKWKFWDDHLFYITIGL